LHPSQAESIYLRRLFGEAFQDGLEHALYAELLRSM